MRALFVFVVCGLSFGGYCFRSEIREAIQLFQNPPRFHQARNVFPPLGSSFVIPNLDINLSLSQSEDEMLQAVLGEKIQSQVARIRECYQKVKARTPASTETEIHMRVQGKKGRVVDMEFARSAMDAELQRCVRFYVKTIRFQGISERERRVRIPIVIE